MRARGSNGGAFGGIQGTELNSGFVSGDRHRTTERIDLLDQVPFADSANRRVAGHLAERLDAMSKQQRPTPQPRCRERSLRAGMSTANNDDFEFRRVLHEWACESSRMIRECSTWNHDAGIAQSFTWNIRYLALCCDAAYGSLGINCETIRGPGPAVPP